MISYSDAIIIAASYTINMPEPSTEPTKFIVWAEDICILLSKIYDKGYDQVSADLVEYLGL